MAEIKKYLDTTALETLVAKIKEADAATLASAQGYADGLAKNYDAAGAAATAESNAKAYTDELANGQVATNKADIATLKGTGEGSVAKAVADAKALVDADVDAVEAIANKNKEDIAAINNAESGILAQAKGYVDGEVARVQGEVDALETYVGTIPADATATNVVAYVQERTAGIATEGAMTELGNRVGVVEGKVATIEGDYLKGADKTELEGKINAKADQTALDAVSGVANAAATQTALTEEVNRAKGEEARIEGLVTAEAAKAREEEGKLNTRLEEVEAFFKLAEGEQLDTALDTLKEIQDYVTGEGAAADQMVLDIAANKKAIEDHIATDHDFAGADAALKTELEGQINAKADASVVTELSGKVSANEQAITALQGVDTALAGRIDALEGQLGESGSVADDIATAKQEAIDAAAVNASNKDAVVLAESQKYTDAEIDKVEVTLNTLQGVVDGKAAASDLTALAGRVTTVEGKVGTLETEMDAVEALAAANKAAHEANASAIALKASQADLEAAVSRIAVNEGAINTINTTLADKAEQDDLDAAVARIAANETAIAANTSAINSFAPITAAEVEAMFA